MRATTALRGLLTGDSPVVAPGVYDGLSARLVRRAGFAAVYATGGGIARSMGYPDLGLLGMTEVTDRLALIVEHIGNCNRGPPAPAWRRSRRRSRARHR